MSNPNPPLADHPESGIVVGGFDFGEILSCLGGSGLSCWRVTGTVIVQQRSSSTKAVQ